MARPHQTILSRTPEPARRSLTLTNTRSPKSASFHHNERSVAGASLNLAPMTIQECDEGLIGHNISDDEDEDRFSSKRFFQSYRSRILILD